MGSFAKAQTTTKNRLMLMTYGALSIAHLVKPLEAWRAATQPDGVRSLSISESPLVS